LQAIEESKPTRNISKVNHAMVALVTLNPVFRETDLALPAATKILFQCVQLHFFKRKLKTTAFFIKT